MKRIFLLLAVVCFGCGKNFLNRNPTDALSSANFWKTQADADQGLTAVYSYLIQGYNYTSSTNTGQGWGSGTPYWESLTDNAFSGAFGTVATGDIEATTGSIQSDAYNTPYKAIEACNIFLANVTNIPLDTGTMNRYIGEVRFIRGYYYFLLAQLYGDVVLTLRPLGKDSASYKLTRTPRAVVIDTVMADFTFAAIHLPNTPYSGHVVRGTALGYITKVYLALGQFANAAATAATIISEGQFSLYTGGYRGLFLKPGQNGNPEIMFSGRYQVPSAYSPADYLYTYSSSFQPVHYLVDDYYCIDGKPITTSPLYNPATPYANRDPRLLATILVPGVLYKGGIPFSPAAIGASAGFLNKKGVDSTRATVIGTQSDQDWVYLRYADVLLMYAEAQNEAAGPDPTVYNAVNLVRARPSVGMPPLPVGLTQDSMRVLIRHERRIELALEGQRYFDLKRWRLDRVVMPTVKDPSGAMRTFPLRDTLWPVPQSEMDLAKTYGNTGFVQTPGYD
ncbi:RagB/SusD family nutrient uptake outer membrane protein [Dinghuibacter silviterrae]|uniref:Putative outer membrane starch-binding protein n=1 Tax=Dinghuibacter silviterrae TaxID=1539049 RepID=A0A4R8DV96_9BACT|nr:RagB/SusD family nutrient uptake outer membrane protein [Dinghuibacter silviterrae]TDX02342.1 putative outer membrane starch-binding protein [Dinghuibacter silviterrae]